MNKEYYKEDKPMFIAWLDNIPNWVKVSWVLAMFLIAGMID